MSEQILLTNFAKDTITGLSSEKKYLSSKYFYDTKGSQIFQDIMRMPEYYLTDCELEIFEKQKEDIFQAFSLKSKVFELVELGAGDGLKTKILLSHFLLKNIKFEYLPIDISRSAIEQLEADLIHEMPSLKTKGLIGDYFHLLEELNQSDQRPKIILFLGSNIGNFSEDEAIEFLGHIGEKMKADDQLFIGFDLKKDPQIILDAYSDPHGHTAAFNLNLLHRINRELDANFDLTCFEHLETYDTNNGAAKSYLVSKKKQSVKINSMAELIDFEEGERIFMEISQKYSESSLRKIADRSGFEIVRNFYDSRLYYTNSLWKLK